MPPDRRHRGKLAGYNLDHQDFPNSLDRVAGAHILENAKFLIWAARWRRPINQVETLR
jgi:hypothetical protein